MEPTGRPETSVTNCQSTPRKSQKIERSGFHITLPFTLSSTNRVFSDQILYVFLISLINKSGSIPTHLPWINHDIVWWGDRGDTVVKVADSIPAGVSGFFIDIILLITLWPWDRLSLEQKWVPGVFSRGKGGRCVRLTTLPPSCAFVTKSGNLNFLEPSGHLTYFPFNYLVD